jgi:hypothetical protein
MLGAAALVAMIAIPASPAYAATWSVTPTPDVSSLGSRFYDTDALSASDAWAVGYADTGATPTMRPMAAHWNGSAWTLASPPTPAAGGWLGGVDGDAADNVWAVGAAGSAGLTQRWNGSEWTTVPSPGPAGASGASLSGVKSFGTGDAWAVGNAFVPSASPANRTLIQHWNGSTWDSVPSPSPDPVQNRLVAVDGVAPDDAWAVGGLGHDGYGGATVTALVLHWNGSSWTRVTVPTADSTFSVVELHDVVAASATEVWAVGQAFHRLTFRQVPYVLRWNGQTWQHTTIPGAPNGTFYGVSALSPTKVYAVGESNGRALVARWNGTAWAQETVPAPSSYNALLGSAATGTGTVWGVGLQMGGGAFRTLAMRTGNG